MFETCFNSLRFLRRYCDCEARFVDKMEKEAEGSGELENFKVKEDETLNDMIDLVKAATAKAVDSFMETS